MTANRAFGRIVSDPRVMAGKPVFKGTRITVDAVFQRIAEGLSVAEVLADYPALTKGDVSAAFRYAAALTCGESALPL